MGNRGVYGGHRPRKQRSLHARQLAGKKERALRRSRKRDGRRAGRAVNLCVLVSRIDAAGVSQRDTSSPRPTPMDRLRSPFGRVVPRGGI